MDSKTEDKFRKVVNIALCSTAISEEQDAAACAFFRLVRSLCKDYDGMVKLFVPEEPKMNFNPNVTNIDADMVRTWAKAFGVKKF
jgi:hypothetical protein